jgi:hypothetical protein
MPHTGIRWQGIRSINGFGARVPLLFGAVLAFAAAILFTFLSTSSRGKIELEFFWR